MQCDFCGYDEDDYAERECEKCEADYVICHDCYDQDWNPCLECNRNLCRAHMHSRRVCVDCHGTDQVQVKRRKNNEPTLNQGSPGGYQVMKTLSSNIEKPQKKPPPKMMFPYVGPPQNNSF